MPDVTLTDSQIASLYQQTFLAQEGCARAAPTPGPSVYAFARALLATQKQTIAALRKEQGAYKSELDLRTHQILTCGVAARHPDANLSRTGVYASKWNTQQAEDVRALRDDRDRLQAELAQVKAQTVDRNAVLDRSLEIASTLFNKWENGVGCYESPDDCSGFLGNAFRLSDDEFREFADFLNQYAPIDSSARALKVSTPSPANQAPSAEPVLYQCRVRPTWGGKHIVWTAWEQCTHEQFADYIKNPVLHDWQYQVRALFAAPPAPAPGEQAPSTNSHAVVGAAGLWTLKRYDCWKTEGGTTFDMANPEGKYVRFSDVLELFDTSATQGAADRPTDKDADAGGQV
jgi:hypothetical protein